MSANPQPSQVPLRLFAVFEGGGAKALVHVGGLKALESRGFSFKGLAGTSAGAIVAALKAAGYTADEMVNTATGSTIFDLLSQIMGKNVKPTKLLGWGWHGVNLLLKYWELCQSVWIIFLSATVALWISYILTGGVSYLHWVHWIWFCGVFLPLFIITIVIVRGGIASARKFRDALNIIIGHKLFPNQPERVAVMGDFSRNGRPALRIVAADLNKKELRLFSSDSERDKDLPVADVVTASMCIPFLFRPWSLAGRSHVDGAIVSNFPIWPFDEERALDLDAITVGFELSREMSVRPIGWRWCGAILQTTLFGRALLNKRAIDRLVVFPMETDLRLLDFDLPRQRVIEVVQSATEASQIKISRELVEIPELYKEACSDVQKLV